MRHVENLTPSVKALKLSLMKNKTSLSRHLSLLFLLLFNVAVAVPARAGGPMVWVTSSRAELLNGEARGVSVTDTGTLMLAPRFTQLYDTEQAYVWSSAVDAAGIVYLGTGHDGRIFRVGADGKGALLYDAPELDVTALVVGRDGALYAGTSPDGKVYRIGADGRAAEYFDPPDKYIWSLAMMPDGALVVGTGDTGKLYRVRAAGAKPEASLLVDINETHVISLAVNSRGDLYAGTDPGGLILRISPEGKAFALFDAPLREIHALAPAADGSIYALALSDAATGQRTTVSTPASQSSTSGAGGSVSVTITSVDESGAQAASFGGNQQQPNVRSRNELQNARSAVFRILPDGGTDVLWSSTSVNAFAVAPSPRGGSVLIGTSDKGRIYSVTDDGRDTLLIQSSEDQISSFVVREREVFAASSNQGKLFRFTYEPVSEGTYESPVRDAKLVAAWGRVWWRGSGAVELQTRSGNTERPDMTWSEWSAPYRDPAGAAVTSPRARFIQWRAVLRATPTATLASDTRVEDVSIAYQPRNVAPEILSIQTLPSGISLQPALQIPVDPNIEAAGLDPSLLGATVQVPPRRAFQRGAVSFQWQAEDRNGDELEYAVSYRAINEGSFHLLKEHLRENFYSVDGAALGDGRYIFRVVVSDAPDNAIERALTGERVSEPVDVDNTPPLVRVAGEAQVVEGRVRVRFNVEDASGRIRRADISLDGAEWQAVFPEDGIADSPRETYALDLPLNGAGEHTITLRAFDASGNVSSTRIVVRRL
jgi:sugar lactone lactonase YvrE